MNPKWNKKARKREHKMMFHHEIFFRSLLASYGSFFFRGESEKHKMEYFVQIKVFIPNKHAISIRWRI